MENPLRNEGLKKSVRNARPWLMILSIFLILKVTAPGANNISVLTPRAVLKAGILDIQPTTADAREQTFDYNFSVQDLEGKKIAMSDLKGKVIFLNLWATWCGPCRVEMPSIQNLYNSVDKDKVAFVMLSLDQEGQTGRIQQFIDAKEFTFPVYQPASPLPKILRVNTIPTTFIISPDGKVKRRQTGTANYDTEEMRLFLRGLVVND